MKADVRSPRPRAKSRKAAPQPPAIAGIIVKKPEASETIIYGDELAQAVTKLRDDLAVAGSAPHALLFGAPGLGKSGTVLQLARQSARPFWWVQVEEFAEQLVSKGAFQFRQIFAAAQAQDAVLVFEDFDSFLRKRDDSEDAAENRRIVAAWLAAMDDFKQTVACIATTNLPSLFDQAIMRRFDRLLYFKRLTDGELGRMLTELLGCESIPQPLLMSANALSPAELTDLTRQVQSRGNSAEQMSSLIDERVRAIKIAGSF